MGYPDALKGNHCYLVLVRSIQDRHNLESKGVVRMVGVVLEQKEAGVLTLNGHSFDDILDFVEVRAKL